MEVGTEIQVTDQKGQEMVARIDQVEADTIRLDFNHPFSRQGSTF